MAVRSAIRTARFLGENDLAADWLKFHDDYEQKVLKAVRESAHADGYVPTGLYDFIIGQKARRGFNDGDCDQDWENEMLLWPTELVAPGDPLVVGTLKRLRETKYREGVMCYRNFIHQYITSRAANQFLFNGQPKEALLDTYHSLLHGGAAAESFEFNMPIWSTRDVNHCPPPHAWGCSIEDNEVYDIDSRHLFSGCEQAGIKLHGPIDVVIRNNHLRRIRGTAGIWLDWMAQGTQVTGNLFHDNTSEMGDLYAEANHGPILVSNNLLLSPSAMASNSRGFAGIHNLILGRLQVFHDGRNTPYMKSHSTDIAGFHLCPAGDYRWFNNVFAGQANLGACNISTSEFPSVAAGNVYAGGSVPSAFDKDALQVPAFNPGIKLVQKTDGWYLTLAQDSGWKDAVKRKIVTTQSLGLAAIPKMAYENADGSPLAVDTDYFGKKRDERNPFPGPFETVKDGKQEIKVWPK